MRQRLLLPYKTRVGLQHALFDRGATFLPVLLVMIYAAGLGLCQFLAYAEDHLTVANRDFVLAPISFTYNHWPEFWANWLSVLIACVIASRFLASLIPAVRDFQRRNHDFYYGLPAAVLPPEPRHAAATSLETFLRVTAPCANQNAAPGRSSSLEGSFSSYDSSITFGSSSSLTSGSIGAPQPSYELDYRDRVAPREITKGGFMHRPALVFIAFFTALSICGLLLQANVPMPVDGLEELVRPCIVQIANQAETSTTLAPGSTRKQLVDHIISMTEAEAPRIRAYPLQLLLEDYPEPDHGLGSASSEAVVSNETDVDETVTAAVVGAPLRDAQPPAEPPTEPPAEPLLDSVETELLKTEAQETAAATGDFELEGEVGSDLEFDLSSDEVTEPPSAVTALLDDDDYLILRAEAEDRTDDFPLSSERDEISDKTIAAWIGLLQDLDEGPRRLASVDPDCRYIGALSVNGQSTTHSIGVVLFISCGLLASWLMTLWLTWRYLREHLLRRTARTLSPSLSSIALKYLVLLLPLFIAAKVSSSPTALPIKKAGVTQRASIASLLLFVCSTSLDLQSLAEGIRACYYHATLNHIGRHAQTHD